MSLNVSFYLACDLTFVIPEKDRNPASPLLFFDLVFIHMSLNYIHAASTRISASKAGFMGGLRPLQVQSVAMVRPARGQALVVK